MYYFVLIVLLIIVILGALYWNNKTTSSNDKEFFRQFIEIPWDKIITKVDNQLKILESKNIYDPQLHKGLTTAIDHTDVLILNLPHLKDLSHPPKRVSDALKNLRSNWSEYSGVVNEKTGRLDFAFQPIDQYHEQAIEGKIGTQIYRRQLDKLVPGLKKYRGMLIMHKKNL